MFELTNVGRLDDDGVIHTSSDGGQNWVTRTLPEEAPFATRLEREGVSGRSVCAQLLPRASDVSQTFCSWDVDEPWRRIETQPAGQEGFVWSRSVWLHPRRPRRVYTFSDVSHRCLEGPAESAGMSTPMPVLALTDDGGRTWREHVLPDEVRDVMSLDEEVVVLGLGPGGPLDHHRSTLETNTAYRQCTLDLDCRPGLDPDLAERAARRERDWQEAYRRHLTALEAASAAPR